MWELASPPRPTSFQSFNSPPGQRGSGETLSQECPATASRDAVDLQASGHSEVRHKVPTVGLYNGADTSDYLFECGVAPDGEIPTVSTCVMVTSTITLSHTNLKNLLKRRNRWVFTIV